MFLSWYKNFSSQAHQPFFTNGLILFILFILVFFFSYSSILVLDTSILIYHAYSMIFIVFSQFFLGFLYVVFPKFLSQAEIKPQIYMTNFLFYFVSSYGFLLSLIFSLDIYILFMIITFIGQVLSFNILYNIHKKSIVQMKKDTKWILIAFASGIFANLLYLLSFLEFTYSYLLKYLSINIGFYLFVFSIIFVIAQRMVPFFTSAKVQGYMINKSKYLLEIVFALLFLKVILLTFFPIKLNLVADIPLFILFTREFIKWEMPIFKVSAIMWILYISLYWIPFAFFMSILESLNSIFELNFIFQKVVIHTIALGLFVGVLMGFGTRVVLGHSGRMPYANNFTIFLFIFIQFVALFRIFASFSLNFQGNFLLNKTIFSSFNFDYIFFINLSSLLLIIALILWSSKYLVILLKKTKPL